MDLYEFDDGFRGKGYKRVAGIDEAGRGPIAGPVVAGAVVLPSVRRFKSLRDSKLVPEPERKRLFFEILAHSIDIGVGIVGVDEIERLNILGATRLAMATAVRNLSTKPDIVLIDAVKIPSLEIEQITPFKGESKSASIAAASIVAKYIRDSLMGFYHALYPQYGFDRHKGYCTEEHIKALNTYGPCPIHRRGFRKVMTLSLPF